MLSSALAVALAVLVGCAVVCCRFGFAVAFIGSCRCAGAALAQLERLAEMGFAAHEVRYFCDGDTPIEVLVEAIIEAKTEGFETAGSGGIASSACVLL